MTHKILNGKRLKADKKERQTTDNSSVRHIIWLTRLMPPATLEQQTTTRLSRTFPTKTLDTKCKRSGDKRRLSKRRSTDLFFVWCRQTMVWCRQTMVWYEQTMVWRRQTIKRRHPNKQTKDAATRYRRINNLILNTLSTHRQIKTVGMATA